MLMRSLRCPTQAPTLPRRSKLAASTAITQSNFIPRRGRCTRWSGSRKASLDGTPSSFQQTTLRPRFFNASVKPSWEPMQSPSGRTWPTTQKVLCSPIPSRMRSMILGCVFILGPGVFKLVNDLQHPVALFDGIINHKPQLRRVFQNDRLAQHPLDVLAVALQLGRRGLLLVRVAENADEHGGRLQVARDRHVVDGDQAGVARRDFAAHQFADLALQ